LTFFLNLHLFFLDGIVSTMRSKAGPSYRVLESLDDYEKFLGHEDHSIIGMCYKNENKNLILILY